VVLEGVPPRIPFDLEVVQKELSRRRPGQSSLVSQRKEEDQVEVLSGVFEGMTTGAPIAMIVRNQDARSKDYDHLREIFRPGHGDYPFYARYGIRDHRGGGRSSGRETVSRVMAGAVAQMVLDRVGIQVWGFTLQVGSLCGKKVEKDFIEKNPLRCADPDRAEEMIRLVEKVRKEGDTIGAVVEIRAEGVPAGLGDPVFDKIDADLAKGLMSIGTVKGVEIGAGFASVTMRGSEHNDPWYRDERGKVRTRTNNAGGIVGGITTGETIVIRCALKPPSSIMIPQRTLNIYGEEVEFQVKGRHDPIIAPRFVPVGEAMVRIVLLDHLLRYLAVRGLDFYSYAQPFSVLPK
jgi:chorismate synthase